MQHIDIQDSHQNDDEFKMKVDFNNIFSSELNNHIVNLLTLKMIAMNSENNWLEIANENVLAELMSWKGKKNGN